MADITVPLKRSIAFYSVVRYSRVTSLLSCLDIYSIDYYLARRRDIHYL